MMKRIIGLTCALILFVCGCAFGVSSEETIEPHETGSHGGNITLQYSKDTLIHGSQTEKATNTLYVGAQQKGFYEVGGVDYSTAVPARGDNDMECNISGKYHVILDPAGPMASGCDGEGSISQD